MIRPTVKGFTLIELLVVIAIMMTVLGLVGGGVVSGVSRAEAQTEVITVYNLVKKSGVRAFTSGQTLVLSLEQNQARLTASQDNVLSTVDFDHLQFEPQQIIFNRNGLPNLFAIEVQVRGKPRTLDLSSLFRRIASAVMEPSNVS
ncbi:prepilin-type N-terminal cleavage/methylation domain-containing protein [Porticoccaceae bacterium]|jgi:prepilin-type N-terminal cleavage/methylation domain-containing protein|nr:prepilin-type N-terminal cleavage/methylation domain-containing protein [Porticoccaceae bacterium]MDC0494769.1 prepilin-type N-terminal cleavage/methylation domain-containing protein [bacterium]